MAEKFPVYEPVKPDSTGASESMLNNPAYLTVSTLEDSAQQGDVGYELIKAPPPKLKQRGADS